MDEDFFCSELVQKFEQMIEDKESLYFDSDELVEIIEHYLSIRDMEYAQNAIEFAKEIHPANLNILIKEFDFSIENNQIRKAERQMIELESMASGDIDYIIACAKFYAVKNDSYKAIDLYQQALQRADDEETKIFLLHNLGNEYLNIDNCVRAFHYFKSILSIDCQDEEAFISCVDCYDEMGKIHESLEFIEQYLDKDPYSECAWIELGRKHLLIENYPEALNAFDFAIAINPKSINSLMLKAYTLELLDKYEEAIEVYQEASVLEYTTATTFMKIGQAYLNLGKKEKALDAFHTAIHEDPQLDKAWYEIALIYEDLGLYQKALQYISRAIELEDNNVSYHKRKAYYLVQMGNLQSAEICYQTILKLEGHKFINWHAYAELQVLLGDCKAAIETIHAASKKFNQPELLYQLSHCYFNLDNTAKGIQYLKKAQQVAPELLPKMIEKYPILKDFLKIISALD
ncbi:tetratricopeptide repeat protein [Ornithobacterium rhinotracheale]|uniref:tetratricopeptide repeat protein n=1 Tax=Ornithobacterium rhinotracheale TaxID=28251 RepID=UPI00129CD259|nr:tetratricopeptide repeat protein [Ornithobacterium rhinotracheale]MRJ07985.1 tetratricopeptide repeat protein [Ornithobacterium rhinotracheale]UOH78505.1 tetratricopeptide repeat protein [Ornithobacterium rhinotracheale]